MMKRILALILCLLLSGTGFSRAESDPYTLLKDALYRIVLRTETGDVTLGSGVLFLQNNVLLTAESCCREGDLYAIGEDGEHAVASYYKAGSSGAAMLELATPSAAVPLDLANYDVESLPYIFGCDAQGNLGAVPMYQVLYAMYRGQSALSLSGEEGLLPGSIMADGKGCIAGLVVAQQMEGYGMYTALEPDSIYQALTGGVNTAVFLPMTASWDEGILSLSWTDGVRENGYYCLILNAEDNSYYLTYETEAGETGAQLAVHPGFTYYMQVQWVDEGTQPQPLNWSAMTTYTLPSLPFTEYGFRQNCYLACAPAGQEVTDILPELSAVTADILSGGENGLYLQVFNTYDVSEEITLPMTVCLAAPDGQVYFEDMSYVFAPEYEQNDVFAIPVDELFEHCLEFSDGNALPAGEYILSYSIGGRIAGEYTFSPEDGQ